MAAFIELTAVPFHMPLKSTSGSGESVVPAEPTEPAELALLTALDCPPPPLEHDAPASARTKASVIVDRMDLTSGQLWAVPVWAVPALRIRVRVAAPPH